MIIYRYSYIKRFTQHHSGYKLFSSKDNITYLSATIMDKVNLIYVIQNSVSGCCIFIHLKHYAKIHKHILIEDNIKEW